jgi:hypothetical protein
MKVDKLLKILSEHTAVTDECEIAAVMICKNHECDYGNLTYDEFIAELIKDNPSNNVELKKK